MDKVPFAVRFREALNLRNMKQSELCEKTNIGKSAISQYLSGSFEPKQQNVYKIALALDVSEAWLMGYDVPITRVTIENGGGYAVSHYYDQFMHEQDTAIEDCYYEDKQKLLHNYEKLNDIGKTKLLDYSDDLVLSGKYVKSNPQDNKMNA